MNEQDMKKAHWTLRRVLVQDARTGYWMLNVDSPQLRPYRTSKATRLPFEASSSGASGRQGRV